MADLRGYGTLARILHWIVALAVLLMIPAGLIMTREGLGRGLQDALFLFHKNIGTLLIPIILVRLAYRATHAAPELPTDLPGWQRRIARISHALLYALLIVMPLSGFIRVRAGGFPIEVLDSLGVGPWIAKSSMLADAAQGIHYLAAMLLIALLALHIGAALYHLLIRRDQIWARMWPPVA